MRDPEDEPRRRHRDLRQVIRAALRLALAAVALTDGATPDELARLLGDARELVEAIREASERPPS